MKREISAGVIIFRKENQKIKFLLLKKPSGLFEFPKGLIEDHEKGLETARREAFEEAGIKRLKILEGFKETIKYIYNFKGEKIFKIVIFYLAQTSQKKTKVSFEHQQSLWVDFKKAKELLKFKNYQELLEKAYQFLKNYGVHQKLFSVS